MRRSAVPLAAIVVAAALLGLLVYGLVSRSDNHTLDTAVAKGERPVAPTRNLPVLGSSGDRSLADLRGRPVLLNFWASWCDPCRLEAPILERAQRELQRKGGTVLGVTYNDVTADSLKFIRHYGLTYPNVRDVGGKLAQAYGTRALPETFLIDRQGRVVALSRGAIDQRFMRLALAKVGA